jgi:hypothetical protein
MPDDYIDIFRQCITLKNGKRICMPKGKAFKIRVRVRKPG